MPDVALTSGGAIAQDDTLTTAIIVSLLTDRRANADDALPTAPRPGPLPPDRRGWCGDALAEIEGDRIGSRLWLLARAKPVEETRLLAIDYAQEAMAWMIEDGLATQIDVSAIWAARGYLLLTVETTLPDGSAYSMQVSVKGASYVI
ncbi:MAG: hypothetical protein GC185_01915 [Alphaproteobacteria bacterium]|nr:hypothetical protein [Alphaproteobacteria bacterium]